MSGRNLFCFLLDVLAAVNVEPQCGMESWSDIAVATTDVGYGSSISIFLQSAIYSLTWWQGVGDVGMMADMRSSFGGTWYVNVAVTKISKENHLSENSQSGIKLGPPEWEHNGVKYTPFGERRMTITGPTMRLTTLLSNLTRKVVNGCCCCHE